VTRARLTLLAGVLAPLVLLAGCGGNGGDSNDAVYAIEGARTCFANADYGTKVEAVSRRGARARKLIVFQQGEISGPAYVTMTFAERGSDVQRFSTGTDDLVRGNVVVHGVGTVDDVITQCLLEAKVAG
jgi:hypothetical protein